MKLSFSNLFVLLIIILFQREIIAQELYFPPLLGDQWSKLDPGELGWCENEINNLYDFLQENNTKAFILLKNGKIVLEKYFGAFDQDSSWYWASAGKSLTAFSIGLAQEKAYLNIDDPTSKYLGESWTSCESSEEEKIKIRHQLTMTSGFDDAVDFTCTDADCLACLVNPGERWAYHNGPYTLLTYVLENATGDNINQFLFKHLQLKTGISGAFFKVGYNRIFVSRPRSMARFGLLILNKGIWESDTIMTDTSYLNAMINPSQYLNKSYGYLWWLNGYESFMMPGSQNIFEGSLQEDGPEDMISALGANGQILNVVPSQNLVMVRMGDPPTGTLFASTLNNHIWQYLNEIICISSNDHKPISDEIKLFPNPASEYIEIEGLDSHMQLEILNMDAKQVYKANISPGKTRIAIEYLPDGVYHLRLRDFDNNLRVQYHKIFLIARK